MITLYDLAELIATAKREIISAIDGIKKAISEIGKQNAHEAARATVELLKKEGLLRDTANSVLDKVERDLRQYPKWKDVDTPHARRMVAQIEACLDAAENEPYLDTIRLFYFAGMKNAAVAKTICCDERTAQRARRELVKKFAAKLYPEEYENEML